MKPEYYVHQHTREVVETTRDGDCGYKHTLATRTEGEHVMTYGVFKTLKERDITQLIGPLTPAAPKPKKPSAKGKTKKQRKEQKEN